MKNYVIRLLAPLSFVLIVHNSYSQCSVPAPLFTIPAGGGNSSSLPANSYSAGDIIINGDFTIDNQFILDGCRLYIAANVTIVVENNANATLVLNNSSLFSCGNVMWDGILVKEAGHLEMKESTLEDARTGVTSKITTGTVGVIDNVFNKNHIHFDANVCNASNITLHGNTFECRDLGNPFSFFGATLETPFLNQQTEMGVRGIATTGTFNIGNSFSNANFFTECKYGINLTNSKAVIKHNSFENIIKQAFAYSMPPPPPPYYIPYTAIIAFSFFGTDDITIGGAGGNEFNTVLNCNYGFLVTGYKNVDIQYNQFEDTNPASLIPGVNGSGIRAINVSYEDPVQLGNTNVNITNNHITNFTGGIFYYFFNQTIINSDNVNISENIIERPTNILLPKGKIGINASANLSNFSSFGNSQFTILKNKAWELAWGIYLTNTDGRFADVEENKIKTSVLNGNISYGIYNSNNNSPVFFDNRIWSIGTSALHTGYHGLYTTLSYNSTLLCNKVINTGKSIYFRGISPGSVLGNVFSNAYDAFTMGANAVIGPQGGPNFASDNKWQGNFTNSKTLTVNGGCNIHSPFYLRGPVGSPFFPPPITNLTSNPSPNEEYNMAAGGLIQVSNPGPVISCPTIFNIPFLQIMQDVVRERIDFDRYIPHSRWISKKLVFGQVLKDSSLLNDPVIDSFALAGTAPYVYLHAIEDELRQNNYAQAISLSSSFSASNLPEENFQNFFKIYSIYYSGIQLSVSDYNELVGIAEQCPLDGGTAVFEARALRDHIDKISYFYEDECEGPKEKSFFENEEQEDELFYVYPNPNDGSFSIDNQSPEGGIFKLYDISGQEVYSVSVLSNMKNQLIMNELRAGLYLYKIFSKNKILKSGKISIIK